MQDKIAIQGIKGSFHHQVALEYFQENVQVDECLSFEALIDSLLNNKSEQAVMAIENSIAGAIIPNYALIDKHNLHIIGEYYLDIIQNLMVLNGQELSEIKEVHSHPMALLQCMDFLKTHPQIKLVEDKDTAETARRIHNNQLKNIAAIAKKFAAKEAVSKAIGYGFSKGIHFKNIEIYSDKNGKPCANINGKAKIILSKISKKYNIFLTLSDDKPWAVATALITS